MQNIEKAIRKIFSKIDVRDAKMRTRVYQKAFSIYEQQILRRTSDPQILQEKKNKFYDLIDALEVEMALQEQLEGSEIKPASKLSIEKESSSSTEDRASEQAPQFSNVVPIKEEVEENPRPSFGIPSEISSIEDSPIEKKEEIEAASVVQNNVKHADPAGVFYKNFDKTPQETPQKLFPSLEEEVHKKEEEKFVPYIDTSINKPHRQEPRIENDIKHVSHNIKASSYFEGQERRKESIKLRKKKNGIWLLIFAIWGIVFAGSAYSLYGNLFGFSTVRHKGTSMPPQQIIGEGSYKLENIKDAQGHNLWLKLFEPGDYKKIHLKGSVSLKLDQNKEEPYLHIYTKRSSDTLIIPLDEKVLRPLQGKTVTFHLIMRNNDGRDTKVSVASYFEQTVKSDAQNTKLKHYIFEVPLDRKEFLFNVTIPDNIDGPGSLYIKSGNADNGYSIDLFGIKAQNPAFISSQGQ